MSGYTDVTVVLDRSASMQILAEGAVGGVNDFIRSQREVPGDGCWSLYLFDDPDSAARAGEEFPLPLWKNVDQTDDLKLSPDQFRPRGNTAYIDALVTLILAKEREVAGLAETQRPGRSVVFVVMTDGQENWSKQYTVGSLNHHVSRKRLDGWKFVFLGANLDMVSVGVSYGNERVSCCNFAPTNVGTRAAYGKTSGALRSWKLEGNNSAKELLISPEPPDGTVNRSGE